jgi:tetratricopeptide (TPR) repeat protein
MMENKADNLTRDALASIKTAAGQGNKEGEGEGWVRLAGARMLSGHLREAINAFERALPLFRDSGAKEKETEVRLRLSHLLRGVEREAQADKLLDGIHLSPNQMSDRLRALWEEERSKKFFREGDRKAALLSLDSAKEASLAAGDMPTAVRQGLAKVDLLELMEQSEQAGRALDDLLVDERFVSHTKEHLSIKMVSMVRCIDKGLPELAEQRLQEVLECAREKQWPDIMIRAYMSKASALIGQEQPQPALDALERSLQLSLDHVDTYGYTHSSRLMSKAHLILGQLPTAIGVLLRAKTTLNDLEKGMGDEVIQPDLDQLKDHVGAEAYKEAYHQFYQNYRVIH